MRRSSEVPVKTSLIPFASKILPDLNGSQYREERWLRTDQRSETSLAYQLIPPR